MVMAALASTGKKAFFRKANPPVGSRPGTLAVREDGLPPRVRVYSYDERTLEEREVDDVEELRAYVEPPRPTWIDVCGLGDAATLTRIGEIFALHPLALEAAVNVPQRARSDLYPDHQVLVVRFPVENDSGNLEVPQVALLVGRNHLLSFRERDFGFADLVLARLHEAIGAIRTSGVDYLAYALLDAAVDAYYPAVERLSRELDELEEEVVAAGDPKCLSRIHQIRRSIVVLRRVLRPQWEATRILMSSESPFVSGEVRAFLRDTYGHLAQMGELLDAEHEMSISLVDVLLSTLSHRTNEVMRMLTLMASIFIPLTFIAGIYGMNFEYMPELQRWWGYPVAIGTMFAVALGMLLYFRRKGWLGG